MKQRIQSGRYSEGGRSKWEGDGDEVKGQRQMTHGTGRDQREPGFCVQEREVPPKQRAQPCLVNVRYPTKGNVSFRAVIKQIIRLAAKFNGSVSSQKGGTGDTRSL